jgi:YD repeat-containing protein
MSYTATRPKSGTTGSRSAHAYLGIRRCWQLTDAYDPASDYSYQYDDLGRLSSNRNL